MRNDNDERNHHNDAGALRRYCYRIRPEQPWMLRMWPLAFICMYTKKGWRRRIHRIELSRRRRRRRRATGGAFAQYRIKIGIANPIVSTTKEGRTEHILIFCSAHSSWWYVSSIDTRFVSLFWTDKNWSSRILFIVCPSNKSVLTIIDWADERQSWWIDPN